MTNKIHKTNWRVNNLLQVSRSVSPNLSIPIYPILVWIWVLLLQNISWCFGNWVDRLALINRSVAILKLVVMGYKSVPFVGQNGIFNSFPEKNLVRLYPPSSEFPFFRAP